MEVGKAVCPKCAGAGKYFESDNGKAIEKVCTECAGHGTVDARSEMMQGCWHSVPAGSTGPGSQVNGYPRTGATTDPYWTLQPSKTLLDEFAMAAMAAMIAKYPAAELYPWEALEKQEGMALGAFEYARAMMKERARRDEMGNVKEVEK